MSYNEGTKVHNPLALIHTLSWVLSIYTYTYMYVTTHTVHVHVILCSHIHVHTLTHLYNTHTQTFHHGFPSQPSCLAYDPVQRILAIATKHGTVVLYPLIAVIT